MTNREELEWYLEEYNYDMQSMTGAVVVRVIELIDLVEKEEIVKSGFQTNADIFEEIQNNVYKKKILKNISSIRDKSLGEEKGSGSKTLKNKRSV